jgi:protoporphyrinogen oxidase
MAAVCGAENLRTSSRITALAHENNRVTAIEIGGGERVAVDRVVSSLPLPLVVRGLWPAAPARVRELAAGLRYRDLLLVVLFLDRPSVTSYASVYFPDGAFPFTRISEPRNRSPLMSPPGKTSLIVEIPCQREDAFWSKTDARLAEHVREDLARIGWIREGDLIGHEVRRIPSAYPILTVDHEAIVAQIADYLRGFENLRLCGRNGLFAYLHLHDVMRDGQHIIDGMLHCH